MSQKAYYTVTDEPTVGHFLTGLLTTENSTTSENSKMGLQEGAVQGVCT